MSPDGRWAVSASQDNTLKVWDLKSGEELRTLTGHTAGVYGVALTSDGRAVSASKDCTLRVWNLQTGEELSTLARLSYQLYGVEFRRPLCCLRLLRQRT